MSRTITTTARQALFDQQTSEAFLILVTIDHADLGTPIRVTSDNVDTVSNSNTYVSYPFDIKMPNDVEGAPPVAQISVDNISVEIANSLRSINSPPSVQIQVVRGEDPDEVVANLPDFQLRQVSGDAFVISGELNIEDISAEPYPGELFTPARFPGLYK